MLERVWTTGNPLTALVEMQIGTTTMENCMEVPQKNENRKFDPATPSTWRKLYFKKMPQP